MIDSLFQDVRYALRGFRHFPTFALTVIATLGLGIGINAAVFTIFNAYVLRPHPVSDPVSLYEVHWVSRDGGQRLNTWDEFRILQTTSGVFTETFAYYTKSTRMDGRAAFGQLVSEEYFRVLGVQPLLGRLLQTGDSSAVVLSRNLWMSRYGEDPGILGKEVTVRGQDLTVVGIAPPDFAGVADTQGDFWVPLSMSPLLEDTGREPLFGAGRPRMLKVAGRLRPGLSNVTAAKELGVAGVSLSPEIVRARLESRSTMFQFRPVMLMILSPIIVAFLLVLLIACANIANLLLARALSRQREISIRLALGAGRSRIVRQLLTESLLLALPAAGVALVVSQLFINATRTWLFAAMPAEYADGIRIPPMAADARILLFMLGAALLSVIAFGLFPALQVSRGGFRPARARNVLLAAQMTFSVLLLICAGVLLRGSQAMQTIDLGMQVDRVVSLDVQSSAIDGVMQLLRSRPDVEAVSVSSAIPMSGPFLPTVGTTDTGIAVRADSAFVSTDYFSVLSIPLVKGRLFTPSEATADTPVIVLSQALAARLWAGGDAIGQNLRIDGRQRVVVGVVKDVVNEFLTDEVRFDPRCYYLPFTKQSRLQRILMKVRGEPEAVRRSIDVDLARADASAVLRIQKMNEMVKTKLFGFHVAYLVASAVGLLAMLLTASGIYSVVSYLVSRRTSEIGIRIALGATSGAVKYLVMRQVLQLGLYGVIIGSLLALGAARLFASRVVALDLFDLLGYAGGIVVVVISCALAAFLPARRAARINPATTLRAD